MIRRSLFRLGLPVLALTALTSAALSVSRSNLEADPPQAVADISQAAPESPIVAALGRVEPQAGLRSVAPEVTGTIAEMAVTGGARVAPGDVLFRLDDRAALRRVAEREAELAAAQAALAQTAAQAGTVRADLAAATARLAAAEARLADIARDLEVAQQLSERDAAAGREVERRAAARAQAQAERDGAHADVARAETVLARLDPATGADLRAARARVTEAEARLRSAVSDLGALTVTARDAGTVLSITLQTGETAGPTSPVLTLAAGDGAILRVFVEETDFGRLDTTRPGRATPRGHSDGGMALSFLGTEPEVRANRELSGRADDRIDTRVVEVLYALPPDAAVLVGQTLDVTLPAQAVPPRDRPARDLADTVAQSG